MNTRVAIAAFVCLVGVLSCSTTKLPPPVANVVGITVDCTKLTGQDLLAGEIAKVTTALATGNFDQADADLRGVVGDLTSKGVLLDTAWQDVACIVDHVIAEAFSDSQATAEQDMLAAQRRDNGQRWMTAHKVTITAHESAGP